MHAQECHSQLHTALRIRAVANAGALHLSLPMTLSRLAPPPSFCHQQTFHTILISTPTPCLHCCPSLDVQCCTGWAAAAGLTGAYSEPNLKDRSLGKAATTAAKAWALAVPVRHILTVCCRDMRSAKRPVWLQVVLAVHVCTPPDSMDIWCNQFLHIMLQSATLG